MKKLNKDKKELRLCNNALSGVSHATGKAELVNNQAPRYIDKASREYIEIPAIILGNTVIWGNGGYEFGAELISKRALRSNLDQWNDKPVVIYHTEGSARDIDNITEEKIGFMYNAELIGYDDDPMFVRLKVILRLDVELLKLQDNGQDIIDSFDKGEIMEMSTGYYLYDWMMEEGTLNGKEYFGIQLEIMPDHLALLPDGEGAFGVKDGGGANLHNEKGESMKENEVIDLVSNKLDEKLKSIPTKDDIGEMVGNTVKEEMKEVSDTLTTITDSLGELSKNKKVEDKDVEDSEKVANEERKNLIAKVKEKKGYSDEVLNATPNEVLNDMLKEDVVPVLGRPIVAENVKVEILGFGEKKEEVK